MQWKNRENKNTTADCKQVYSTGRPVQDMYWSGESDELNRWIKETDEKDTASIHTTYITGAVKNRLKATLYKAINHERKITRKK